MAETPTCSFIRTRPSSLALLDSRSWKLLVPWRELAHCTAYGPLTNSSPPPSCSSCSLVQPAALPCTVPSQL